MKTIRAVNHGIDNPSNMMISFNKMFQTSKNYRIKGLNTFGHRQYNHDMLSSVMTGFMTGGLDGAMAAYAHVLADLSRDVGAKRVGYTGMDLMEAAFMHSMYLNRKNRTY